MKTPIALLVSFFVLAACCPGASGSDRVAGNRESSFDSGWRFLRADAPGAEVPSFDDTSWRTIDLPHDWSLDDLPPREMSGPELSVVAGQWHFQKGDDAAWKTREFDDNGWQSVNLPDHWERHSNYTNNDVKAATI